MSRFGARSSIRWRALVLTAGFGTRLRPLTWTQPKPLLPLCGRPLVSRTLESLALAGCETAVLNLHHLPDAIPETLGDEAFSMPLRYSREDPILGTLGALSPPHDVLADADAVVVVNGDSLCRWPVESVLRRHVQSGADVTLLLLARSPDAALGGGIAVDEAGRVVQMRELPARPAVGRVRRHVFAGLHVLRPELLQRVPDGPGDVIDGLYQPLLEEGREIRACVTRRLWHDVGTPRRYMEAALEQAARPWTGLRRPGYIAPNAQVPDAQAPDAQVADDARVRRSVLEAGVVVEAGARVERSLLLPGSRVGRGAVLKGAVLGPGVQLSPGSNVEGRLLTRRSPKHVLSERESQLGDVVYSPLV